LEGRRGVVGVGVFILGNLEVLVAKRAGWWRGEKGVRTFGSAAGSGVDARKGFGIVMAAESRNRCGMYCASPIEI
jgi:hypothetical protein